MNETNKWIYGVEKPKRDRHKFLEKYKSHNRNVKEYFDRNPYGALLVMDITDGDGWEKLCPFLDATVLLMKLPKRNTMKARRSSKPSVKNKIRQQIFLLYRHYRHIRYGNLIKRILK